MANKQLLGEGVRKVQPKLRVLANRNAEVNALRSLQCGAITVEEKVARRTPDQLPADAIPQNATKLRQPAKKGKLTKLARNVLTNVFVQMLRPSTDGKQLAGETARRGNIATATIDFSDLNKLASDPNVAYIEVGATIT